MAKAVKRPAESWVYVLKGDRALPEEEQSRFTLRPMTYFERAAVLDDFLRSDTSTGGQDAGASRVYRNAWAIALNHIASVENFPVGTPAPWPESRAEKVSYLGMLENDDVLEIGNEVWSRSGMGIDGETIKNSLPPEPISRSGGDSAAAISTTAMPVQTGPH